MKIRHTNTTVTTDHASGRFDPYSTSRSNHPSHNIFIFAVTTFWLLVFLLYGMEAYCPLCRRTTRSARIVCRLAETGGETTYVGELNDRTSFCLEYAFLPTTNTLAHTRYMLSEHRFITHFPRSFVDTHSYTAC